MVEQRVEQGKQLVVQSNPLVEAQYRLDMLAQKIIRYLVSKIKPNDQTFKNRIYTLVVQDFCEAVDREYQTKVFQDIRAAAEKLLSTKITIRRGKEVTRTAWIASYKYHENEGWFEFSLSTHLERELLKIKDQFTKYYLKTYQNLNLSTRYDYTSFCCNTSRWDNEERLYQILGLCLELEKMNILSSEILKGGY